MLVLKQKTWLLLKPNKQLAARESIMIYTLSLLQNMQEGFLTSFPVFYLDNIMFSLSSIQGKLQN